MMAIVLVAHGWGDLFDQLLRWIMHAALWRLVSRQSTPVLLGVMVLTLTLWMWRSRRRGSRR